MTRVPLTKKYQLAISGLGITEVVLGSCIFCFGLGTSEVLNQQNDYSNILYIVLALVTSLAVIIAGGIAIDTAKYSKTSYLLLTLVFSTIATLFALGLLGFQIYVTILYAKRRNSTAYTLTSLILSSVAAGTSFFLCLTNICLTCNAGGACGQNIVEPTEIYVKPSPTVSPYQNNVNGIPRATVNNSIALPLHEPPDTAKVIRYWNQGEDLNNKQTTTVKTTAEL